MGRTCQSLSILITCLLTACATQSGHKAAPAYKPEPWFPADGSDGEIRMLDPHNRSGGATYRVTHPHAGELEVTTDGEGNIVGVRRLGR